MQDRSTYLGGTDANQIAQGNMRKVWLEKTGRAERPDLSDVLRVQLGLFTEPFNRRWFEQRTGVALTVPPPDQLFRHPTLPFLACHPDALYSTDADHVWDAKHTGSGTVEEKLTYYQGQLTHNALATGRQRATLSVLFGNSGWGFGTIAIDRAFAGELMAREADLWDAIQHDIEPDDLPPIGVVAKTVELTKELDLSLSNAWVEHATIWIGNAQAAVAAEKAKKELKELVPGDVKRAFGAGVEGVRNRAGALTIRAIKEKPDASKVA